LKVLSIIKPDIVLFVGDISDGSVKIIKKINDKKENSNFIFNFLKN